MFTAQLNYMCKSLYGINGLSCMQKSAARASQSYHKRHTFDVGPGYFAGDKKCVMDRCFRLVDIQSLITRETDHRFFKVSFPLSFSPTGFCSKYVINIWTESLA